MSNPPQIIQTSYSPFSTPLVKKQTASQVIISSPAPIQTIQKPITYAPVFSPQSEGNADFWKQECLSLQNQKVQLEKDLQLTQHELEFWRSKVNSIQEEAQQQLKLTSQINGLELEKSSQIQQSQVHQLENENKKLRQLINDQSVQIQLLKEGIDESQINNVRASNAEKGVQELNEKIGELVKQLTEKQQEINKLKMQMTQLELKSTEVFKLEREIRDLKGLLEFRNQENAKLRNEKTQIQLENFKSKQTETTLKETQNQLQARVESLRGQIEAIEKEKQLTLELRGRAHSHEIEQLSRQHQAKQDLLFRDLKATEKLLLNKSQEAEDWRRNFSKVAVDLDFVKRSEINAKAEASVWHERCRSVERDKSIEIENLKRVNETTVNSILQRNTIEKGVLQERLSGLARVIDTKEKQLRETSEDLIKEKIHNRDLSTHNVVLNDQVRQWQTTCKVQEERNDALQRAKDRVHNEQISSLKHSQIVEKSNLQSEIAALQQIVQSKRQEAAEARQNAHFAQLKMNESQIKERQASTEAQIWRQRSQEIERQKSLELQAAEQVKRQQIDGLSRVYQSELDRKNREKMALSQVLDNKQREVQQWQVNHSRVVGDLLVVKDQANRLGTEAGLWRSRAQEIETQKNVQLAIQNDVKNRQIINLQRQSDVNQAVLLNTANRANQIAYIKSREADDWRNNYHRLYTLRVAKPY